ncbi:MAG TPA: sigma-70 family RNA polymerase sigma factor [Bacteroidota bacterium]
MNRTPEHEPGIPDVVRLVQAGDKKAFERLYREHERRVYAVCLRIVADTGRAEELTQDVFVRVWNNIASFRGESAFSSWLHRLTVNVVLVELRTEKRYQSRVATVDDLEAFEGANPAPAHGGEIDLEAAIARLPVQARAIFVLHDIEGYRHEEIAEHMGLAVGTSKAQLHRARKLLREALNR